MKDHKVTAIILFVLLILVTMTKCAHAEEVWSIKDGKLLVQSVTTLGSYPAPPEGVSPEIAGTLITGKVTPFVLVEKGKVTLELFRGIIPYPRITTLIPQTKITFNGKEWKQEKLRPKEIRDNWYKGAEPIIFVVFILFPVVCVLWYSVLAKAKATKVLGAFAIMLIFIAFFGAISAFLGLNGSERASTAIMILSAIVGMVLASAFSNTDDALPLFAGSASGLGIVAISYNNGFPTVIDCIVWMASVFIVAFACNRAAIWLKRRRMKPYIDNMDEALG